MSEGAPAQGTGGTLGTAVRLLRRHAPAAFLAAAAAAAVNAVPDVLRHVLVWDDPRLWTALAVDVVGFLTGLVAQLWVTGAVAGLLDGGRLTPSGALRRGVALAVRAVRRAPGTVLAGVVTGGAVSALLTLPASVAALGFDRVLGPLDSPDVGAFAVATVSDFVASTATLPYLAFVLVLVATGWRAGQPGTSRA
ncbi:hypothetical protein [Modestobacter sp. VKM Ac-2985]|uniref:hypothetical protein n=1 Tax=Modestobacter sp. VKM Ac-2985 TaxID=3004139 RepID=UPI0022AB8D41|nr:hypothetical protein [Modestobacter sp. VKM Ac-2985]MCZ2839289.1 hypothetical protein [Modestobacter sp. VKM Ac-2985]